MCILFDPAIPGHKIHPKEMIQKVSKDVFTRMFDYSVEYNKQLEVWNVHESDCLNYLTHVMECYMLIGKMMLIWIYWCGNIFNKKDYTLS